MWTMLTLYGEPLWDSPFVFGVFVALREKRLDFDMKVLDLSKGEHRRAPFAEASLTARVPAIEHDGFWLSESLAIIEYLEEEFPAPDHPRVLPATAPGRARARQLLGWLRSGIDMLRGERPTTTIFYRPARTPLGEAARADADRLIQIAERLLPAGATTLFPEWTVCDAELAFALHRLIASGDPVPDRLRAYAGAVWSRPSVRLYVDHERPELT
jgi:glutathione S-transferase